MMRHLDETYGATTNGILKFHSAINTALVTKPNSNSHQDLLKHIRSSMFNLQTQAEQLDNLMLKLSSVILNIMILTHYTKCVPDFVERYLRILSLNFANQLEQYFRNRNSDLDLKTSTNTRTQYHTAAATHAIDDVCHIHPHGVYTNIVCNAQKCHIHPHRTHTNGQCRSQNKRRDNNSRQHQNKTNESTTTSPSEESKVYHKRTDSDKNMHTTQWILDPGSSSQITGDPTILFDVEENKIGDLILMGPSEHPVHGVGKVRFVNENTTIILTNVLLTTTGFPTKPRTHSHWCYKRNGEGRICLTFTRHSRLRFILAMYPRPWYTSAIPHFRAADENNTNCR